MADTKSINVKEMLLSGASKEELIKALENEIAAAQKEIDEARVKEEEKKKKDCNIDRARNDLIFCIIKYLDALGLIDANIFDDKDYKELNDSIKQLEEEMAPQVFFIGELKKAFTDKKKDNKSQSTDESADDIIQKFLKSL